MRTFIRIAFLDSNHRGRSPGCFFLSSGVFPIKHGSLITHPIVILVYTDQVLRNSDLTCKAKIGPSPPREHLWRDVMLLVEKNFRNALPFGRKKRLFPELESCGILLWLAIEGSSSGYVLLVSIRKKHPKKPDN